MRGGYCTADGREALNRNWNDLRASFKAINLGSGR